MRSLFALVVLALLVAGCTDDAAKPAEPIVSPRDDQGPAGKTVGYEVNATTANETELEGAHLHDEWGDATALPLADMTVSTSSCGGGNPFVDVFLVGVGVFRDQEVHKGCAIFAFDEGKVVPEGTARLYVDIDASGAMAQGGLQLTYGNEMRRSVPLEESTESVHSWTIEMEPVEWDLPHSTETDWYFFLQPSGQLAIMDGDIKVTITAERVDDWKPILGSAHIDHWDMAAQKENHVFLAEHTMRLLDTNVTVVYPSFADRIQRAEDQGPIPLDDIIAPETSQVTLAVQWDAPQGCPAGHGCWVVAWLAASNGGGGRGFWADPVMQGADWAIYTYDVPAPMAPDSTYANQSVYNVRAFVRACPNGEPLETPIPFMNGCLGEAVATMSADTRFEVEAWKGPADLEAVKTRLGLS